MNQIDVKIDCLRGFTSNFPFIEYYSHTNEDMYKILNEHTEFRQDKHVLCSVLDGFEMALDKAIEIMSKKYAQDTKNNS